MKPPILIGIALGLVILAASIFAPALRSSASRQAVLAQDQATLALRQLARYNPDLPRLNALAAPEAMKQADAAALESAVAAAKESLERTAGDYSQAVRRAHAAADLNGLPAPDLPKFSADVAGVQRAIADFARAVQENDALLAKAAQDAAAAVTTDANALGVTQTAGMIDYVRAANLSGAAEALRARQAAALARLLEVGVQWKVTQGALDEYRGLDTAQSLQQLGTDQEELGGLRRAADEAVTALTAQVTERRAALTQVEKNLRDTQQALQTLEEQGFRAGHDDDPQGFPGYRTQYLGLHAQLRELQQREQELRKGVLHGAELDGDDWAGSPLSGGEALVGLEELERRLATAQERARRLENADASLDAQAGYLTEVGQRAQAEAARFQERLTELEAAQQALTEEIPKLAAAAFNKEEEALQAARRASDAFAKSQRAADAWLNAARTTQRERDPNRKNERLALVLRDVYLEHVGRSAEAAARLLAGRIYAQRALATQSLIEDMRRFTDLFTAQRFTFDPSEFQAQLDAARTTGIETVDKAAELYNTIAEKLSSQPTAWVPLGALAATYHLRAQLGPDEAATYLARAGEVAQKAVEKRERFPYAATLVRFRDHLAAGGVVGSAPTAPTAPGEPTEPTEPESDFFED